MFKRFTRAELNQLERKNWLETKERGKYRFIRQEMLFSILIWLAAAFIVPATEASRRKLPLLWGQTAVIDLLLLALCLFGGYLTGRWKWTDFEKKYPGDKPAPRK